jgi:methyl-accepting chemotaxis protein
MESAATINRTGTNTGGSFIARSLTNKIGAIILVLVALVLLEVGAVYVLVQGQATDSNAVDQAGRLSVLTQTISKESLRLTAGNDQARNALARQSTEFAAGLNGLTNGNADFGLPPASNQVRPSLNALAQDWRPMSEAINSLVTGTLDPREYDRARDYLIQNNDALLAKTTAVSQALLSESAGKTNNFILFLAGMAVLAFLVFIAAIFFIRRWVTRPVQSLADVAHRVQSGDMAARAHVLGEDELGNVATSLNTMLDEITALVQTRDERDALQQQISKLLDEVSEVASGDLTVQAEVTAGTLGSVADAFNYMIEELRAIIENVNRTASEVATSTERILSASGQLAQQAELQAQRIMQATTAVDELSNVADTVALNAATGAEIALTARQNAAQGSEAVRQTVEGMNRIRSEVQETSKKIKRLGESSQEIGQIVQLIQDIADQTNLLALNAAIQAAMAGEHGRGFAVVADEVRRLAERASTATKQISGLVTSIQSETNEAVLAMENGTREVVEGSQLANAAGQYLESINQVVDQLSELIEEISGAAAREAEASAGIRQAMAEISQTTTSSAAGTRQAAESVGYLARLSEQLQGSVAAFRLTENGTSAAKPPTMVGAA